MYTLALKHSVPINFFFFFELAFGSNNLKILDHLKLIWKNFGTCPHIIKKSFLKKKKKKDPKRIFIYCLVRSKLEQENPNPR